jgi:transcriptional regulator with XRE-family HTH domain
MQIVNENAKTPAQIMGENIKSYRNLMGFSQEQLAAALGISRPLIAMIESGKREVGMIHLMKLSNLLCVEISDLVEENEEVKQLNSAVAFKKDSLNSQDVEAIAGFRKIVMNYVKLSK